MKAALERKPPGLRGARSLLATLLGKSMIHALVLAASCQQKIEMTEKLLEIGIYTLHHQQ